MGGQLRKKNKTVWGYKNIREQKEAGHQLSVEKKLSSAERAAELPTEELLQFSVGEKKEQIEKLRRSAPIEITGKEIKYDSDLKQYKKNAIEYAKGLQGFYTNADTGHVMQLQRGRKNGGVHEVLQHDFNETQIQSVAAIPQIIEKSIYITSAKNEDGAKNPNVSRYHYFVCGLKIGGEDYTVRMVEAEEKNGNRYYDHRLTKIEKGKLLDLLAQLKAASTGLSSTPESGVTTRNRPTNSGEIQSTPISNIKDKRLISILQDEGEEQTPNGTQNAENGTQTPMQMSVGRKKARTEARQEAVRRRADDLAERYGVEVTHAKGTEKKGKGWQSKANVTGRYDPRTDKTTITVREGATPRDVERTVYTTAVANKGLAAMFGEDEYNAFLHGIYEHCDEGTRRGGG